MICIFIILLSGWCGTRVRRARLVSYAFLYTTETLLATHKRLFGSTLEENLWFHLNP